jgi:hypothetical protein
MGCTATFNGTIVVDVLNDDCNATLLSIGSPELGGGAKNSWDGSFLFNIPFWLNISENYVFPPGKTPIELDLVYRSPLQTEASLPRCSAIVCCHRS